MFTAINAQDFMFAMVFIVVSNMVASWGESKAFEVRLAINLTSGMTMLFLMDMALMDAFQHKIIATPILLVLAVIVGSLVRVFLGQEQEVIHLE